MKKVRFQILAVLAIAITMVSCGKDDTPEAEQKTGSATIEFMGKTYTDFNDDSFGMVNGTIALAGDGYLLTLVGVGAAQSTVDICNDPACDPMVTMSFTGEEARNGIWLLCLFGNCKTQRQNRYHKHSNER